jgi:hypothetical protein
MPRFRVTYPEVWNREYIVEAANEEEAEEIAHEKVYAGDEADVFEYAWTHDPVVMREDDLFECGCKRGTGPSGIQYCEKHQIGNPYG